MAITPDTKDWTWVLQRPCPECGFNTQGFPVEAVFFDHGQLATKFRIGDKLDTAFRLKRTRWDGYWRLEMELLDVATVVI